MYGIPHGWGANVLMWNQAAVHPGPRLVGRRLRREQPLQGEDHGVRLADLHRRRRALPEGHEARPEDHEPVRARRHPVQRRRRPAQDAAGPRREYWSDADEEHQRVRERQQRAGHRRGSTTRTCISSDKKVKVGTTVPKEGSTGWSDTWMISAKAAKHPNCMYKWFDWIVSPKANAQVAEYFGEAPAQTKACSLTRRTRRSARPTTPSTRPTRTRSRTGRRRPRTAATTAAGLQGLLRLDVGLDGHQGLMARS